MRLLAEYKIGLPKRECTAEPVVVKLEAVAYLVVPVFCGKASLISVAVMPLSDARGQFRQMPLDCVKGL